MGIPTLISTATASNASEIDITSGIDSTYDEYMFVFTDIGPATDNVKFTFQVNVDGQSGFNETITSSAFDVYHAEDDSAAALTYSAANDQAEGTGFQPLGFELGNGADESCAGILHLFTPSNTTYVTNFYARTQMYTLHPLTRGVFIAGYVNVTGAVDEISFKMDSGNFDGVIQMYGIA